MKADQRLKSTIYSYDLADNDYYQGLLQVEEQILQSQKEKQESKVVAVDQNEFTDLAQINN